MVARGPIVLSETELELLIDLIEPPTKRDEDMDADEQLKARLRDRLSSLLREIRKEHEQQQG
ncbi:Uncharacterized protein PBTT_06133 [Plasmodiophora brassicae]